MKIRITLENTGYTFVVDSKKITTKDVSGNDICNIVLTEEDVDRMNFWLNNSTKK